MNLKNKMKSVNTNYVIACSSKVALKIRYTAKYRIKHI